VSRAVPRIEMLTNLVGKDRVVILLVGDGTASGREVAKTLGVPVAGQLPEDDKTAAVLSDGLGSRRSLDSRPLIRAAATAGRGIREAATAAGPLHGYGEQTVFTPYASSQPGLDQYDAGQPGLGQYDAGQPGLGQYDASQPSLEQYDAGHAGLEGRDVGQPGLDQYDASRAGLDQYALDRYSPGRHGLDQIGLGQSGPAQPGAGQFGFDHPERFEPGGTHHGNTQNGSRP
jgi:hypothetical protein